jgi:hypothetical protein
MLPPSGTRFAFPGAPPSIGSTQRPPVGGAVCAYLDCPSLPEIVLALTSGRLPPSGTLGGREVTLVGGLNICALSDAAIARAAFPGFVLEERRSMRRVTTVVADVAAYAMARLPGDMTHPLPYREPIYAGLSDDGNAGGGLTIGGYSPPSYAAEPATLLYFDGAVWRRFPLTGGTSPNPSTPDVPRRLIYSAGVEEGTPLAARPRKTDVGAPFYLPDGRLHSILADVWEWADGQATTYALIPAQVALAQLRALPALAGYDIRGLVAPESVAERVASMRDHAAPVVTPPRPTRPASAGVMSALAGFVRSSLWGRPHSDTEEDEPYETDGEKGGGEGEGGDSQWLLAGKLGGDGGSKGARVTGHLDKKKR